MNQTTMRNKNLIIIAFLATFLPGYAQQPSSQSIRWTVSELTDMKSDTTQSYESYFICYQTETIVWVQTKREDTFIIKAVNENWRDIHDAAGQIEYTIEVGGVNGTLRIVRQNNTTQMMLALTSTQGKQMEYRFTIASFQAL